jgi:hypothetical protein
LRKIARDFRQAAQIIKYQALWKSCSSLPFTRGSAAAGNVSVKVIPEDEAKPVIEYIRVSTQQQGKSGLGLEAQRKAISRFAEAEGFDIVETFVEIESTKGDTLARRPKLQKAPRRRSASRMTIIASLCAGHRREARPALARRCLHLGADDQARALHLR